MTPDRPATDRPPPRAKVTEADAAECAARSVLRRARLASGLCPDCGECGAMDAAGGCTCSTHGLYTPTVGPLGAGVDPEAELAEEEEEP